jgi:hypothetical protein
VSAFNHSAQSVNNLQIASAGGNWSLSQNNFVTQGYAIPDVCNISSHIYYLSLESGWAHFSCCTLTSLARSLCNLKVESHDCEQQLSLAEQ